MSDNASSSSSGGVGFFGLLTIVLITLKLLGKISLPWVWVLSPLWIPAILTVLILLVALIISAIAAK
jgi:hypothetical protein